MIFHLVTRRTCCRCGKPFVVLEDGVYLTREECVYHAGKLFRRRGNFFHICTLMVWLWWQLTINQFFFFTQICNIEINYFVSAVQNAAVYERELYVVFLGKVFFLPWKTEEFIKLVDLESTRILEVDEKVTSP